MPYLGTDFSSLLDYITDSAYTGFWDTTKKNFLIREATVKAVQNKIANNNNQEVRDAFFNTLTTNVTVTPTTNTIDITEGTGAITDYFQIQNMKARFLTSTGVYITAANNATPAVITVSGQNNLSTGQSVFISGVSGSTNCNGVRYLKRLTPTTFALYSDSNQLLPIIGNGTFSGSANIQHIVYDHCKEMPSNRKDSSLNAPNPYDSYYEIADGKIKIYPLATSCSQVTIDYIKTPYFIDVTDSTTDILTYYNRRMIDFIADETARLMGAYSRDYDLLTTEQSEIIQQP